MRSIRLDLMTLSELANAYKARGGLGCFNRLLAIRQCYDNYTGAQMEYLIEHYRESLLLNDLDAHLSENLRQVTVNDI